MKKNIITILLLISILPYKACSQEINYQKLVLKKVLTEESLSAFFKDKKTIKLVKNRNCTFNSDAEFKLENKTIKIINENNSTLSEALEFIGYENAQNYVTVEITLFNINVIYSATYKKIDDGLKKIMTNTTFIKSPRN